MARGSNVPVGTTRTATNGYHYTKTETGWRLTHHIIAEQTLGRPIRPDERVVFKDGKRANLLPGNVEVKAKGYTSIHVRKDKIQARIEDLVRELNAIEQELETHVTWSLKKTNKGS